MIPLSPYASYKHTGGQSLPQHIKEKVLSLVCPVWTIALRQCHYEGVYAQHCNFLLSVEFPKELYL